MQRVDEMTEPPTVGRFYLVRCIRNGNGRWYPVMGPAHADPELAPVAGRGAAMVHHHYDARFMRLGDIGLGTRRKMLARGLAVEVALLSAVHLVFSDARLMFRKRRCLREMPLHPTGFTVLNETYAAATLKGGCKTCPHRGVPLASLPAVEGVVTCPGHGLRWNVSTGALVRGSHP